MTERTKQSNHAALASRLRRPSDRSYAIELHENLKAITKWRATLPERQRRRLIGAQANVKRWRASLNHGNGKCPQDLKPKPVAFIQAPKARL